MSFTDVLASNLAIAFGLAVLAWLSARFARRPFVTHLLWVLALLKLLSPPIVGLPLLPAPEEAAIVPLSVAPPLVGGELSRPAEPVPSPKHFLGLILAGGALVVLALAAARAHRFRRLLENATVGAAPQQRRVAALGERMGLARAPKLFFIDAPISPMVWPTGWRSFALYFPTPLWHELSEPEQDALLSHELAHLSRRDPWMRFVELASVSLFWWYPVSWWARAGLRRAEELCCDDLVLAHLPKSSRAYADGLVKTMDFLSQQRIPTPSLGTGADGLAEIRERITEIMTKKTSRRLSPLAKTLVLIAAVFVLGSFPAQSSRVSSASSNGPVQAEPERDAERQLAREALEIQRQRVQLQLRHLELEQELTRARHQQEVELMREQAQMLRNEGQLDESRELERHAERAAREGEHQSERLELEARKLREVTRLQLQLHELEAAAALGRASERRQAMERVQNELHAARLAHLEQEQELQRRVIEDQLQILERERDFRERQGRSSEAAMLELEMRRLAAEQELTEARLELQRKELELQRREAEASRGR